MFRTVSHLTIDATQLRCPRARFGAHEMDTTHGLRCTPPASLLSKMDALLLAAMAPQAGSGLISGPDAREH